MEVRKIWLEYKVLFTSNISLQLLFESKRGQVVLYDSYTTVPDSD